MQLFHDKFQVKQMYTESHDITIKHIREVKLIMITFPISKVISYNQFTCIELNETVNHMLGHGNELKSLHIDMDSDWRHPSGRCKSEFLKKIRDKVKYQKKQKCTQKHQSLFDETLVRCISALLCDHIIFIIPSTFHSNHGPCRKILNKICINICTSI